MKKIIVGIALFTTAFLMVSQAQSTISPEAVALLEKAKAVHGGAAFDKLNVIFMRFQNAFFVDDKGTLDVFSFDTTLDFQNTQVWDQWFGVTGPVREYLVTAKVAKGWYNNRELPSGKRDPLNDTGVLELDSNRTYWELRRLRADVLGLRFGAKRDFVLELGIRTLITATGESVTGTALSVSTEGESETLVFANDGTLIAASSDSGFTLYSEFQTLEGIRIPTKTRWFFANGSPDGVSRIFEFKSIPKFEPGEFKPVKWDAKRDGTNPFGFKPTPANPDALTGLRLSAKNDWFLDDAISAKAGLKPGDEIVSVNGKPVQEMLYLDAQKLLWDVENVVLEVKRSGQDGLLKFNLEAV
jgi:PDZ domain